MVAGWLAEIAASDPSVANQAAVALGALSDKGAASDLLSIVSGDGSTLVRANAARALGKCGGPAEAAVLATTTRDARQPLRVGQEAALALGKIGDGSTVPALIAIVEQTAGDAAESEQLRISALQALGEMTSSEARQLLARYARGDLSPTERAFIARAVRQGG